MRDLPGTDAITHLDSRQFYFLLCVVSCMESPTGRCGFTLMPEDVRVTPSITTSPLEDWYKKTKAVCCWRKSWNQSEEDRCIWHADTDRKPIGALKEQHHEQDKRLDGAILRGVDSLQEVPLADKMLRGADLREADFSGANFSGGSLLDVDLTNANLSHGTFTNAYFTGSNLNNVQLRAANLNDANLSEVDLTDADLKMATLSEVYLVNANLRRADLRYATLSGSRLHGAELIDIGINYDGLGEFKFDETTTFGGKSRWEADKDTEEAIPYLCSINPLHCLGRPFTNPDNLRQAELQYRATQRLLRANNYRQLIEMDVREKHALRKRELSERNYSRWLKLAFYRWPLGYGERVLPVVGSSLLTIVGFAVLFPFVGGMRITSNGNTAYAFRNLFTLPFDIPHWIEILWANLYFSMVTFTTLGYGDIQPASSAVQALASLESLIGALLMAFFVFVLGRRATSGMK